MGRDNTIIIALIVVILIVAAGFLIMGAMNSHNNGIDHNSTNTSNLTSKQINNTISR